MTLPCRTFTFSLFSSDTRSAPDGHVTDLELLGQLLTLAALLIWRVCIITLSRSVLFMSPHEGIISHLLILQNICLFFTLLCNYLLDI